MVAELVHPQLLQVCAELDAVDDTVQGLSSACDEKLWQTRPEPDRWSAAENIVHLNLTSAAMLPLIKTALDEDEIPPVPENHVFRRDILGAFLSWTLEPPYRYRMQTSAPFLPRGTKSRAEILAEFDKLQQELRALLVQAQSHDLAKLRIVSPFDARVRYNLYSAFKIIPPHQRRHLWQAQNAMRAVI